MGDFRIVPLPAEVAQRIRATRRDDFGHVVVEQVATSYGPCRVSLRPFVPGHDRRLLFSYISSRSSTFQRFRWAFFGRSRGSGGLLAWAFFIRLAMLMREIPVSRTMLRWEVRSPSSASTCSYCADLATAAGTNRA